MVREWPDSRGIYYGTAAERAAFPAAGESPGAMFFDYDDKTLYKWNGAVWVAMATIITPPADHTHAGAGTGGQLDWDNIWTDAAHDHSAAGEGGQNLHAIAELEFEDPTELTIVGGAITRTQVYHTIAPETGTSDILTTINGGSAGDKLIIRPKLNTILHVQSDIVNIHLSYVGFDYEMTNVGNNADHLELTFDGNVWAGGGAVDPIPSGVDPTEHSHSKLVASDGNPDPALSASDAGVVTAVNWLQSDAHAFKIKNTSGGAVVAGALGYIDSNAEFKTTTTAYADVAWCVVVTGGNNNADIYVARRGEVDIIVDGNNNDGDFIYTSTTAGQGTSLSYVRPEVMAVVRPGGANAGGAGGTCQALLLTGTVRVPMTSSNYVLLVSLHATFDFRATINGAPVGAAVTYNAPSSGNENTIDPADAAQLGKIRLYNETRGDYALIDDVDTGTNVITLTANAPAAWANNDVITTRSQTTVYSAPPPYYYEIDLSSADNTVIPELARAIILNAGAYDSAGAGYLMYLHPYETWAETKQNPVGQYVAALINYRHAEVPLFQRRFCVLASASGAATKITSLRLVGYDLAVP